MFGISFTLIHLNQAGALVHVYTDGSIHLNHGGTEMGQGLFTKVAQVVAEEFGVPLDFVRITATNTAKVPNASPTAASSGTDINGMAAKIAAGADPRAHGRLRRRALERRAEDDRVPRRARVRRQHLDELRRARQGLPAQRACNCRRPAITRRRRFTGTAPTAKGKPFFYFAFGAACAEVGDRHADRRDEGAARRHPARRRLIAQSGDRSRPGRGRLHPGHGLADHRGARLRRRGAADDARAGDLQDPGRVRHAARSSTPGCTCGRTRPTASTARRRSASRR